MILSRSSEANESSRCTEQRGVGVGLVHVEGWRNQNAFRRRASVLALRIASSSSAASSMASSSEATAPTQAESGAQFRRRRLYFCSDAWARGRFFATAWWAGDLRPRRRSDDASRANGVAGTIGFRLAAALTSLKQLDSQS